MTIDLKINQTLELFSLFSILKLFSKWRHPGLLWGYLGGIGWKLVVWAFLHSLPLLLWLSWFLTLRVHCDIAPLALFLQFDALLGQWMMHWNILALRLEMMRQGMVHLNVLSLRLKSLDYHLIWLVWIVFDVFFFISSVRFVGHFLWGNIHKAGLLHLWERLNLLATFADLRKYLFINWVLLQLTESKAVLTSLYSLSDSRLPLNDLWLNWFLSVQFHSAHLVR